MVTQLCAVFAHIESGIFWRNRTLPTIVSGILLMLVIVLVPIHRTSARVFTDDSPASMWIDLSDDLDSDSRQYVMAPAATANPVVNTKVTSRTPAPTEATPKATSVLESHSRFDSATPCGCTKNRQAKPTYSFMLSQDDDPTRRALSILDVPKPLPSARSVFPTDTKSLLTRSLFSPVSIISPSGGTGQFAPPPANDLCENAVPFSFLGGSPIFLQGTTVDATLDNVGFCGTQITAPGVWYKVTGTDNLFTVTTCSPDTNYDTKISVFSGDCDALSCDASNDDDFSCPVSIFHSLVEWPAAAGVEYYILVHGFGNATGDFSLGALRGPAIPPANDLCSGAFPLEIPSTINGNTRSATFDDVGDCGTSNTAPGIWYRVMGTGSTITATTCSPDTNYDTKISVFTGDCNALTCVDGNDDDFGCPNNPRHSAVSWYAESGMEYLILVHGFSMQTGEFQISVTNSNTPPTADAGADQPIHACDTVSLDGTASFDDNTASLDLDYAWSFFSKPAESTATLVGDDTATPSFVADMTGTYVVELVVTDEDGLESAPDQVEISSNNLAPTAAATVDFSLAIIDQPVNFDGDGSTDPELDELTYAWTITAAPIGSAAALVGADTANPFLTPDLEGDYEVTLNVYDCIGAGTPDTVEITATTASGFAEIQIIAACDLVEGLSPAQVKTKGNQRALCNVLRQAIRQLQNGRVDNALDKLGKALDRTDGCVLHGEPDGNGSGMDWITDCDAQAEVYGFITDAMTALEL